MTKPKKRFKVVVVVVANYRQAIKGCSCCRDPDMWERRKKVVVSDQKVENCELMILTLKVGKKGK